MERERRILAFLALRSRLDELFEKVDKAQRELDVLWRRDKIPMRPDGRVDTSNLFEVSKETEAALKALQTAQKAAVDFHEDVYVKERDEMTALGILKPRASDKNYEKVRAELVDEGFVKPRPGKGRH